MLKIKVLFCIKLDQRYAKTRVFKQTLLVIRIAIVLDIVMFDTFGTILNHTVPFSAGQIVDTSQRYIVKKGKYNAYTRCKTRKKTLIHCLLSITLSISTEKRKKRKKNNAFFKNHIHRRRRKLKRRLKLHKFTIDGIG